MSKKSAITFAIVIVLTSILFGVYFSITKNKVEQTRDITSEPLTFKDFLPFGTGIIPQKNEDTNTPIPTTNPTEEKDNETEKKIQQVSMYPVAGAISFFKEIPIEETLEGEISLTPKTKKVLYTRQIDKATGHIYETNMETMEEKQISNTTIPRIYEAYFSGDAKTVIYRYLGDDNQTIETYTANIQDANETQKGNTTGTALPSGITELAVDQNGSRFFYLFNFSGTSVGNTMLIDGTKKTEVFKSPITEWIPFWIDSKTLGFQTKASAYALGYFYSYDLSIKSLNKIIGGIAGLTTLPNRGGSMILYGATIESSFTTSIYNVAKKQSTPLDIKTIPEKCVWGLINTLYCSVPQYVEKNIYPDSWYQGLSTFNDSFYEVDPNTGFSNIISSPENESIKPIDGIKPFLAFDESYLFVINKKDNTLWSINLK